MQAPHHLLRRSVDELLRMALSICDVRFGVVRLKDEVPIVSGPAVSSDLEESLALLARVSTDELVIFDHHMLRHSSPEVRFYAALKLLDSSGTLRGTVALLDDRPRALTDSQKMLLIGIAGQLTRVVEMAEALRSSGEELDRLRPLVDEAPVVQLREREEYFRALTDQLTDVVAIITGEGVLTYVSPSIGRVLGHEPDELLGKVTWAVVHPDDQERICAALRSLAGGDGFEPAEFRFQHQDGRWRTLEVVASNLLEHPQIHGLVLNLRDVTDRKRMERELGQLHRLTSIGRLAAQMAHEFNNVLMGIQPMVEAIRRRANDDAALLRFTDVIFGSIQRGKRVTTDILRFGRPSDLALRTVGVQELMQQMADEIRPMLGERITVELGPAATPMRIYADPARLAQVFVNLALNARDAMEAEGGTLRFEARRGEDGEIADAGAFVHFTVTDTGSGIAAEDLPYLFEPLFTTKRRGTGLGLSVVFQIVAAHGGHITVTSAPGNGTTFHLFIPVQPVIVEAGDPASGAEAVRPVKAWSVLIVEDDEAIASGLRFSLEAEGLAVDVVRTGAEVLPAIARFRPDVMVLDLSLPDEDGRAVYERVAAISPLPVVFSSGYASQIAVGGLGNPSRTAFLMKPYTTDELLFEIQRLL